MLRRVETRWAAANDAHLWAARGEGRLATPIYVYRMGRESYCVAKTGSTKLKLNMLFRHCKKT